MVSTCFFCAAKLPRNEVVEATPIGRRLAFNERTGRLWVVCRACDRWNLVPMHERWEGVESCERLFRETRTRTATGRISLARAAGGIDLTRSSSYTMRLSFDMTDPLLVLAQSTLSDALAVTAQARARTAPRIAQ